MFSKEINYIDRLSKADFDHCTLSVAGYSMEFKEKLKLFN